MYYRRMLSKWLPKEGAAREEITADLRIIVRLCGAGDRLSNSETLRMIDKISLGNS